MGCCRAPHGAPLPSRHSSPSPEAYLELHCGGMLDNSWALILNVSFICRAASAAACVSLLAGCDRAADPVINRSNADQREDAESNGSVSRGGPGIVPDGEMFRCMPTRVWDGDGPIWCAEGPRIRLAGIAAREMDESCRPNHPCPPQSGRAARDHLVALLGGPRGEANTGHIIVQGPMLICESEGSARGSRTAAWCRRPDGVQLSCAMVTDGYALRWEIYDPNRRCDAQQ